MKKLSKDEMKLIMGGQQPPSRVACMECGGSIGTLCLTAPPGGTCIYFESSSVIECADSMNMGEVTFHYCSDFQPPV